MATGTIVETANVYAEVNEDDTATIAWHDNDATIAEIQAALTELKALGFTHLRYTHYDLDSHFTFAEVTR